MPKPIAIQLYTLREDVKQQGFPAIIKLVAGIGYKGVELAGLQGLTAAAVRKLLDEYNLKAVGAHEDVFDAAQTQRIVDDAKALGYVHLVKSLPREAFEKGESEVKKLCEKINEACTRFAPHGLKVSLHNHWWEFKDPALGDLVVKSCPKVGLQQDIYWVQTSGQDPAKWIEKYAKQTWLLHVKDGPCDKDKAMTAVGKGIVDVKACLKAAEKAAVEWYSVELDRCDTDMIQAVKDSYAYLVGNKLAAGNR